MCDSVGIDKTIVLTFWSVDLQIINSLPLQVIEEVSIYGIRGPSKMFDYVDSLLRAVIVYHSSYL